MTNQTILAFFAGAASAVIALYTAGQHSPVLCAAAGAALPLAAAAIYLAKPERRRQAARILAGTAAAPKAPATVIVRATPTPEAPKAAPQDPDAAALESDLASALKNFKVPPSKAEKAARAVVSRGVVDFNQAFKLALAEVR